MSCTCTSDGQIASGNCCSKCTAPSVETNIITGDPWPALWQYGTGWSDGFNGTAPAGGEPFIFTFVVQPGDDLPYYRIEFDDGDFDWDPDAVVITTEDGTVVTPDMVFDEEEEFTVTLDPSAGVTQGDYTGGIKIHRQPAPDEPADPEDDSTIPVEVEITPPGDAVVRHAQHDVLPVDIRTYSGNPIEIMFPIRRIGTGAPTWSIAVTKTGWPAGSSYTLRHDAITLVEGDTYGPIVNDSYQYIVLSVNHTDMVAGQSYEGSISITTQGPGSGTDVRQFRVRKVETLPFAWRFDIQVPETVARGTPFDVVVHAINLETDTIDTDYDGGTLSMNLSSMYSPPDVADFNRFESAGLWSAGALTIPNFSFSGGAGPSWPFLQVFDHKTRAYGVHQFGSAAFKVTINGGNDIDRGVPFNVEIQAIKNNGDYWWDYEPTGNVNINLTSADPADVIAPLLTDNTGWSNGRKVVSCTITGGGGDDEIIIEAEDAITGYSGSETGYVKQAGFILLVNGVIGTTIKRGTAFNMTIQKLQNDGTYDTTFVPTTTLSISYSDGVGGTMTPTSTNNVGWVDGAKTVSCTVTGGSADEDIFSILVEDDTTGAAGAMSGDIVEYGTFDHFEGRIATTIIRSPGQKWYPQTMEVSCRDSDGRLVLDADPTGGGASLSVGLASSDPADVIYPTQPGYLPLAGFSGGVKTFPSVAPYTAGFNIWGSLGGEGTGVIYIQRTAAPLYAGESNAFALKTPSMKLTYSGSGTGIPPSGTVIPLTSLSDPYWSWTLVSGWTIWLRYDNSLGRWELYIKDSSNVKALYARPTSYAEGMAVPPTGSYLPYPGSANNPFELSAITISLQV